MPETADSFVSLAESNLAAVLSESSNLRTLLQVSDAASALQKIYAPVTLDRLDGNGLMQYPRPRVLIGPYDSGGLRREGVGGVRDYGILELCIEAPVPVAHRTHPKDALRWFENLYGKVLMDVMDLGNSGGSRLYVKNFEPWMGPDEIDPDKEAPEDPNLYYGVIYHVHY